VLLPVAGLHMRCGHVSRIHPRGRRVEADVASIVEVTKRMSNGDAMRVIIATAD
jgi:hypothetical protein